MHHLDCFRNKLTGFDEEKKGSWDAITLDDESKSKYKLDPELVFEIKGIDLRCCLGLNLQKFHVIIQILAQNESLKETLEYIWIEG